jgi:hypothetical protein
MTLEAPHIDAVLGVTELLELLREFKSVFVVGVRAKSFWEKDIEAYPFPQGALLIATDNDEVRYPAAFVRGDQDSFIISRTPSWFGASWSAHLEGIVESKPGFHLPDYAFPPMTIQW